MMILLAPPTAEGSSVAATDAMEAAEAAIPVNIATQVEDAFK